MSLSMSTTKASLKSQLYLDDLEIGVTGFMIVMVCKIWDVNATIGRYLSTDFVICDSKPNKDEFRILKNAPFIVEFDGETSVRKAFVKSDGFIRYPFKLVELENLEVTNNKYLIDVIGYVTNVGRTVQQRSGTRTLDFYLANSRFTTFPMDIIHVCYLAANFKKCYGSRDDSVCRVTIGFGLADRLYLSSSSSTLIIDDDDIPALKQIKTDQRQGNLTTLMFSQAATFNCEVRIDKAGTKKDWNYPSCGRAKCKKTIARQEDFWCDSCERIVEYPVMRYRLELEVSDHTVAIVVVMFDETATSLVRCSVDLVLAAEEQDKESHSPLPNALANIVGTTHNLELKAHTYYEHDTYESFTCWKIVSAEEQPSPATPSKPTEEKKRKRVELEDSDAEASFVADTQSETVDGGTSSKKKCNKRLIVDSFDME
ncbi:ATP-dependent DNA helicase PIF1-like protein [Tanacetum coccineum]